MFNGSNVWFLSWTFLGLTALKMRKTRLCAYLCAFSRFSAKILRKMRGIICEKMRDFAQKPRKCREMSAFLRIGLRKLCGEREFCRIFSANFEVDAHFSAKIVRKSFRVLTHRIFGYAI
jgi:hypothetical protein